MRTTIRLDDQLLREIKQLAAQTGQTLTAVVEEALREMLVRRRQMADRQPVKLITTSGQGLQPGVDLDDSAALLELMDKADDLTRR